MARRDFGGRYHARRVRRRLVDGECGAARHRRLRWRRRRRSCRRCKRALAPDCPPRRRQLVVREAESRRRPLEVATAAAVDACRRPPRERSPLAVTEGGGAELLLAHRRPPSAAEGVGDELGELGRYVHAATGQLVVRLATRARLGLDELDRGEVVGAVEAADASDRAAGRRCRRRPPIARGGVVAVDPAATAVSGGGDGGRWSSVIGASASVSTPIAADAVGGRCS